MTANQRPIRVQMSRKKGWRMPANTVYVGRPTVWGNPFKVDGGMSAEAAVAAYRLHIQVALSWHGQNRLELAKLRGKNLACWCKPGQPCHADVLIELANA